MTGLKGQEPGPCPSCGGRALEGMEPWKQVDRYGKVAPTPLKLSYVECEDCSFRVSHGSRAGAVERWNEARGGANSKTPKDEE